VFAEWSESLKAGRTQAIDNPVIGGYPAAEWPVYLGRSSAPKGQKGKPMTQTIAELEKRFWQMSDGAFEHLRDRLFKTGRIRSQNASRSEVWAAWADILQEAAKGHASGIEVTPGQILARSEKDPVSKKEGLPDKYTIPNKQVNITDPMQASDVLSRALQDALGRNPTAAERQGFIAALNAAERANPTITRTTYTKQSSGQYATSSVTTGGVQPVSFAQDWVARQNPGEIGAYQAATTYMGALLQALGAPV